MCIHSSHIKRTGAVKTNNGGSASLNRLRQDKMDTASKQLTKNDSTDKLSDKMKKHLWVSKRSSSVKVFRPKLQATKSFPPYSQCIGGLGQDTEVDTELLDHLNPQENVNDVVPLADTKNNGVELTARGASHYDVKDKLRIKRKERLAGNPDEWENMKGQMRRQTKKRGIISEDQTLNGGMEMDEHSRITKKTDSEMCSTNQSEDTEDTGETSLHQWSSPHPILSKLLHSSTSSSCSSICASSGESDEVFSEGENVMSKKKTLKKSRSWKTFLTMMHWSLKRQSSWVQLAGHQGNFHLSEGGEVLKLYSEGEAACLKLLMKDPLRPFVPQYYGLVTRGEHCYIRLEDLLGGLKEPVIMDCKIGVRTYQEEEVIKAKSKPRLRNDLYQKIVRVDPSALSAEEHAQKGVTKWRYLHWRDTTSSTSTLGFRIEGIMMEDGNIQKDFRNILTLAEVTEIFLFFSKSQSNVLKGYLSRLLALDDALKRSDFFRKHEVIGSSLLFVHDRSSKASAWMIDFGKTVPLLDFPELKHDVPWTEGSREDGYLLGLTSLIASLSQAIHLVSRK